MIGGERDVQVWVATVPVDMRKSFDSLAEIVRSFLGHDPLSGNLFVFRNRSGQRLKILWWDQQGLAIFYKRIERGVFHFPQTHETSIAIERSQLLRLLSGLQLAQKQTA
jgi:transposase